MTLSNFSWLGGTGGARPRVVELWSKSLVQISGRICVSWRKDYVHFVERKSVWNGKCKRHPQHPVVLPTIPLYPHLTPHHLVQLQENAAQAPRGARNEGQQGTTTLRRRRGRRVLAS